MVPDHSSRQTHKGCMRAQSNLTTSPSPLDPMLAPVKLPVGLIHKPPPATALQGELVSARHDGREWEYQVRVQKQGRTLYEWWPSRAFAHPWTPVFDRLRSEWKRRHQKKKKKKKKKIRDRQIARCGGAHLASAPQGSDLRGGVSWTPTHPGCNSPNPPSQGTHPPGAKSPSRQGRPSSLQDRYTSSALPRRALADCGLLSPGAAAAAATPHLPPRHRSNEPTQKPRPGAGGPSAPRRTTGMKTGRRSAPFKTDPSLAPTSLETLSRAIRTLSRQLQRREEKSSNLSKTRPGTCPAGSPGERPLYLDDYK